jgi:hypothetical protein
MFKFKDEHEVKAPREEDFRRDLQALLDKYNVHLHHEEVPTESHGEWSTYDSYYFEGPGFSVSVIELCD